MQIDFSKGAALHRLYGHYVFMIEARKRKKPEHFILAVCRSKGVACNGRSNDWRHHLNF